MNSRSLLVASIVVAVTALAGCGSDPCAQLADNKAAKAKECNLPTPATTTGATCEGAVATQAECEDRCLEAADCDALTGKDMTGAQDYLNCVANCESEGA